MRAGLDLPGGSAAVTVPSHQLATGAGTGGLTHVSIYFLEPNAIFIVRDIYAKSSSEAKPAR